MKITETPYYGEEPMFQFNIQSSPFLANFLKAGQDNLANKRDTNQQILPPDLNFQIELQLLGKIIQDFSMLEELLVLIDSPEALTDFLEFFTNCIKDPKDTFRNPKGLLNQRRINFLANARNHSVDLNYWDTDHSRSIINWAGNFIERNSDGFVFPNLETVRGDVIAGITDNSRIPKLRTVGGTLDMDGVYYLDAPNLQTVGKNLTLPAYCTSAPQLRSVGGNIRSHTIYSFGLPQLEYVGGDIDLKDAEHLDFPKLKFVGGSIIANKALELNAPLLQEIVGELQINPQAKIDAPNLVMVNSKPYNFSY